MDILNLSYPQLDYASQYADKLAREAREYSRELKTKAASPIERVTGEGSSYLDQAQNYLGRKMDKLRDTEEHFSEVARNIRDFREFAEDTDRDVACRFKSMFDTHITRQNIEIGALEYMLTWAWTGITNESEFGNVLGVIGRTTKTAVDTVKDEFKSWYETEGGRYWVEMAMDVVECVVAVVVAVTAVTALIVATAVTAGLVLSAAGALLAAVLAVINLGVSLPQDAKAAALASDPENAGEAYRESRIDKMSDFLRRTNMGDAQLNEWSNNAAGVLDYTQLTADILKFFGGAASLKNHIVKFGSSKEALSFMVKNADGSWSFTKDSIKSGWESIKNGGKTSAGISNMIKLWKDTKTKTPFMDFKEELSDIEDCLEIAEDLTHNGFDWLAWNSGDFSVMNHNSNSAWNSADTITEKILDKIPMFEKTRKILDDIYKMSQTQGGWRAAYE